MGNGGAWIGFHFAAFALDSSSYPQNWEWYQNKFLRSGSYAGNTWRPTTAILKAGDENDPVTNKSSANEWYRLTNDLRINPDIKILLSIDTTSFLLGTGPKQHEIWRSGYFPVVWSNKNFRMIYINIGHNDIDYEHKNGKELSFTSDNPIQNKLIIDCLLWLGETKK